MMGRSVATLLALLSWSALAPVVPLWAQPAEGPLSAAITLGKRVTFASAVMGGRQSVMVYTPPDHDRSDARYPVLYVLDAESNYYFTAGIARLLAGYSLAPALIVVGIISADRNRDFVPTEPIGPVPFATSPGADHFLKYIEHDVQPLVERTYRTEPYRILVGHSLGGLFAVHALVARPALFNAYVSISPSLWWNGWEYRRLIRQAIEGRPSFKKYLFVSIADEERDDSWRRLKEMETSLNAHAPRDFRFDFRYFGDENQATTVVESTLQALKRLYARWPLPSKALQGGVEGILAHYASLSQEFGYQVQVTEQALSNAAGSLSRNGRSAAAIPVLEFLLQRFPRSEATYLLLADEWVKVGDRAKAKASLERLLALSPGHVAAKRKLAELSGEAGASPTVPPPDPEPEGLRPRRAPVPSRPGLDEVLRLAGETIVRQARESAVILGEERCRQRAYEVAPGGGAGGVPAGAGQFRTAERRWLAELALVQLPAAGRPAVPWMEVRDVFELDGKRLPDRDQRLEHMLQEGHGVTARRAREIVEENAKHNLGPVRRTINTPTIPLLVLHPLNQERFNFSHAGEATVRGAAAWKIAFEEEQRPTLIRGADDGSDMASSGVFWIVPATGEVVRAELQCGDFAETRVSVTYQRHPRFELTLPVRMVEKALATFGDWVEGECDYSNYRRFETGARVLFPKLPDAPGQQEIDRS